MLGRELIGFMTGAVVNITMLNQSIGIETIRKCVCECGIAYDVIGLAIFNLMLSIMLLIFFDSYFKEYHNKKLNIFKFERMKPEDRNAYIMDRLIIAIFILNLVVIIYNLVNHFLIT